jgi:hypothetical protein
MSRGGSLYLWKTETASALYGSASIGCGLARVWGHATSTTDDEEAVSVTTAEQRLSLTFQIASLHSAALGQSHPKLLEVSTTTKDGIDLSSTLRAAI